MGEIWRVRTSAGPFAVKRLFWTESLEADGTDVAFQNAVLAAGVRLPRPIAAPNGDVVVDGHRVYEWIDLHAIEGRPASPSDITAVAAALACIHGLAWPADREPDPWYVAPIGAERWDTALRAAVDAGAAWAADLAALQPQLLALDAIVASAPPAPMIRCHLDYNRSNVWRDERGELTVLDWENSGPGVADREVAAALLDWATDEARVADRAAVVAFLRAYGEFRAEDLHVFALRIAAWTHYLAMVCENVADPASPEDHVAFWREDVEAMLRRPLTVDNLEQMLTAIDAVRA
jgi:hypothetical protein